jgi:monoamine oxidase
MAGLGAARALRDAGARVTVIEARDRIGGRTHTSQLWPDLPVDTGASWIHGTKGNPVTALARELGVRITPTTYARSVTFNESGQQIEFVQAAKQAMKLVEKARAKVDDIDADVSLQTAIEASKAWRKLPAGDRRIARLAINTRIEHEYSGDWSRLSAWHFDDGKDLAGHEAVLTPGYGPIVARLARGLDIRLDEPVTAIAPIAGGVEVSTSRGLHRADHVIVTLPLGVLKSGTIRLAEPLERRRQRAIDRLDMGLLNKCVLRFDRLFWPSDIDWIDFLGPVENLWGDWTSYYPATGHPLLAAFNAARVADEMEALDDRETVASAMAALRMMLGSAVPDPVGAQVSRWRQDPFARGSYSFQPVGSSHRDRSALFGADWEGRLFFAGEATSRDHAATTHGALMTGRAAAALVFPPT